MRELWRRGEPATVREMHAELSSSRPLAYTTVMTVMDTLHRNGHLARERIGPAWLYHPVRTAPQHAADLMLDVLAESGDPREVLRLFVAGLDSGGATQLHAATEEATRTGH